MGPESTTWNHGSREFVLGDLAAIRYLQIKMSSPPREITQKTLPKAPLKTKVPRWTLRSGQNHRFRAGHPWVFSNELAQAPAGVEPGGPVELINNQGEVLARGYGNPHSLIAFRVLTRDPAETDPWSTDFLLGRLKRALRLRTDLRLGSVSFRLCFGEADQLPGLIIDRYLVPERGQIFVIQAHTAGADQWMGGIAETLEVVAQEIVGGPSWKDTAIWVRNDLAVRQLEGISIEEPRLLKSWAAGPLGFQSIQVPTFDGKGMALQVPIESGQKTAFYLDQAANIRLLIDVLKQSANPPKRILDICSYVGQWGAQISRAFHGGPQSREFSQSLEFTLVDASQPALDLAEWNLKSAGASKVKSLKADAIGGLGGLPSSSFDLVIADPPALVKGRKHLPAGKHAYLQLNTDVFRLVRDGGWVVSCSCSGLLEEADFISILSKAARREGAEVSWIARGMHAPDHPVRAEFPEGLYLKCWIGRVQKRVSTEPSR